MTLENGAKLRNLLELNYSQDGKLRISPVGEVVGLDGRTFSIDGNRLVAAIQRNGIDIVLDENHSFGRAAGWFQRATFETREDGIYATLEKNELGEECIAKKYFKYLSPVFDMNDRREVVGLDSVGLVNRPNLLNDEVNEKKQQGVNVDETLKELNTKLLESNSMVAELNRKLEANGRELEDAKSALKEANVKLDTLEKERVAEKEANKKAKIEAAVATGKLSANARDFALALENDKVDDYLRLHEKDSSDLQGKTELEKNQKKQLDDTQKSVWAQLDLEEEKK